MFSRHNENLFEIRHNNNINTQIKEIPLLDFTMEELHLGHLALYYHNYNYKSYKFNGQIDNFMVFKSRQTRYSDTYYTFMFYFNTLCPFSCNGCEHFMGRYNCLSCKEGRIKKNNECVCKPGSVIDFKGLNCIPSKDFYNQILFYDFNNTITEKIGGETQE